MGDQDTLFPLESGKASFERLEALWKDVGTDWLELTVFEGTHEFCRDDAPIARLVQDLY